LKEKALDRIILSEENPYSGLKFYSSRGIRSFPEFLAGIVKIR